jgi:hypothetical protein
MNDRTDGADRAGDSPDGRPDANGSGGCPLDERLSHERAETGSGPEPRRCGGKTRNGTPCKRGCVPGRTRCKLHGGNVPIGPLHGRWRTGKYSKYMPKTLAADFRRAVADPKLLPVN